MYEKVTNGCVLGIPIFLRITRRLYNPRVQRLKYYTYKIHRKYKFVNKCGQREV